jgi:hypothetical protein
MKRERLQQRERERLDHELTQTEQARLVPWEVQELEDVLPEVESEPSGGVWRPLLLVRIFQLACRSKLGGRR